MSLINFSGSLCCVWHLTMHCALKFRKAVTLVEFPKLQSHHHHRGETKLPNVNKFKSISQVRRLPVGLCLPFYHHHQSIICSRPERVRFDPPVFVPRPWLDRFTFSFLAVRIRAAALPHCRVLSIRSKYVSLCLFKCSGCLRLTASI